MEGRIEHSDAVARLLSWIWRFSKHVCLLAGVLSASLSAHAQFVPDKGVTVSHWKEPTGGLEGYWWLSDREVLYAQRSTPTYRFVKWNVANGIEQDLPGLAKLACESNHDSPDIPSIYPSPNGKYVAWTVPGNLADDTLLISSLNGTVLTFHPYSTFIYYPSWSEDSQTCFCFLHAQDSGGLPAYGAISMIGMTQPYSERTLPIPFATSLRGDLSSRGHLFLPDVRFKSRSDVRVLGPISFSQMGSFLRQGVRIDDLGGQEIEEYRLKDSAKPITRHLLNRPSSVSSIVQAILSPNGNSIAWKFQTDSGPELWTSDIQGKNMARIGTLPHDTSVANGKFDGVEVRWLPSGTGISFREAGELYVVSLNASVSPH